MRARSDETELMDLREYTRDELRTTLHELEFINRHTGGHAAALFALRRATRLSPARPLRILDVGAGGGDALRVMAIEARRLGVPIAGVGLEVDGDTCALAAEFSHGFPELSFVHVSATRWPFPPCAFDLVHSAQVTHHLFGAALDLCLRRLVAASRGIVVIQDLERSLPAELLIGAVTRLFSRSRLIRHDAPASVRRGFTTDEWRARLAGPAFPGTIAIERIPWFRHRITIEVGRPPTASFAPRT